MGIACTVDAGAIYGARHFGRSEISRAIKPNKISDYQSTMQTMHGNRPKPDSRHLSVLFMGASERCAIERLQAGICCHHKHIGSKPCLLSQERVNVGERDSGFRACRAGNGLQRGLAKPGLQQGWDTGGVSLGYSGRRTNPGTHGERYHGFRCNGCWISCALVGCSVRYRPNDTVRALPALRRLLHQSDRG